MIVPMVYRAGILRDGSLFQNDYCTDGQWIRFVGGKIRKMKGQREVRNSPASATFIVVVNKGSQNYFYFANSEAIFLTDFDLTNYTLTNFFALTNLQSPPMLFQSVIATIDTTPHMVFFGSENTENMLTDAIGTLYTIPLGERSEASLVPLGQDVKNATGGIIFSNPNLYIYGSNGTLYRSRTNNPLSFKGGDSDTYVISTNKIIFGAQVRGGSNTPSFLFWTQNEVIYLTNVSDGDTAVDFQREVVTTNSSLMSSRSVVQFDSLFFWLGTDKVYVYNGVVDSVPNTVNLDYFLDNVDLNKRQKIFGYKISRYGEVRWAYPEKKYADDPNIGCTRELVYNIREKSWYDTILRRDCATVFEGTGDIFSFGEACSNFRFNNPSYVKLWKHEIGTTEVRVNGNVNIPSFFTTPFYGLASFNPARSGDSSDEYLSLESIEPDFHSDDPRREGDRILITVRYKKYATNALVDTTPVSFSLIDSAARLDFGKVEFRVQARFMNITFRCDVDYSIGTTLLTFKGGDLQ